MGNNFTSTAAATGAGGLAGSMDELRVAVSHYLGLGDTYSSLSAADQTRVDRVVSDGLREFYQAHEWRFMKPTATASITEDDTEVDLPSDLASILGDITIDSDGSRSFAPVAIASTTRIDRLYSMYPSSIGVPTEAAVRQKSHTGSSEQRYELRFWPKSDNSYTLRFQYAVRGESLSTGEYPYGGTEHFATIRNAVLAMAERTFDDATGVHQAAYERSLMESIRRDNKFNAPDSLGFMSDGRLSTNLRLDRDRTWAVPTVTVSGNTPI